MMKTFKRSWVLSFTGSIFLFVFIVFLWLIIDVSQPDIFKICWRIGLLLIIIMPTFINEANYFIIKEETIIIKNQLWPWYKKEYSFKDICKVVFTQPPKRSKALMIVRTKRTNTFNAASLKKNDWMELKKIFKEKKILVEDNLVFKL